jgi:hypothetical protein
MAAYLSPLFGAGVQLFNNQGIVLSGGKIWTYQAGTTTPFTTWTDSTQTVANANPIILDSAGRPLNEIWLQSGYLYKFILTDSNDNILGTWDNISGVNDITTSITTAEWSTTSLTPSYINPTTFSVPGNNVSLFEINRRVKIAVGAGTVYGYVVSSVFGTVTTVVIVPDSTVLDAGISSVSVGLLDSVHVSIPQQYLAMNAPLTVASATTTPIGATMSANVIVSGVVTITAFDNVLAGIVKLVKFTGILTLTHNGTSLILPGAVNITTGAGDQAIFRSLGSGNWECVSYLVAAYGTIFANAPIVGNLYSVTCTQGTGALTCGLDANIIRYRSTTLTNGQPATVFQTSPVSLVVPSGATLGGITTVSARLILIAINNAGATELAIINSAGGNNLDETVLISTTAISAAATAANVFYSTSARTNVAFKVVGCVDAVNTAGAWGTPALVQGSGGNALSAMSSLGYGQTWQVVTRVGGTTYYNTTGKPIGLSYYCTAGGVAIGPHFTINGIANIGQVYIPATQYASIQAIVPVGGSYVVPAAIPITVALELR